MKSLIESKPSLKKHFMWHNPLWGHLIAAPMALGCLAAIISLEDFSKLLSILGFFIGLIYWSLFEYAMHRYIYHVNFKNKTINAFWMSFHAYHHRDLSDKEVLNANYLFLLPMAVVNFVLLYILSLGNLSIFLGSIIGLISFYMFYEWVHYSIHTNPYKNSYIQWISKYHLYHHHKMPKRNFGNTTSFWDHVLGTYDAHYKDLIIRDVKY